jgi:Leucine-rich repeat (LRR) protein
MNDLPIELLELCLPKIDLKWAMQIGGRVCRRWRSILLLGNSPIEYTHVLQGNERLQIFNQKLTFFLAIVAKRFNFWSGNQHFASFMEDLNVIGAQGNRIRQLDLSYSTIELNINYRGLFPEGLCTLKLDSIWYLSDLSPLARCTKLQELSIRRTNVTELGPILHLTSLRKLDFSHSPVLDSSSVTRLVNLRELGMSFTKASDGFDHIQNLNQLENLSMVGCGFKRLSALNSAPERPCALKLLDLTFNEIEDLSFLKIVGRQLIYLGLGGNSQLRDVSMIGRYCRKLTTLILYGTQVTRILDLVDCRCLEILDLSGVRSLTTLEGISELQELRILDLSNCCLQDLTELGALRALSTLNLETMHAHYDLRELQGVRLRQLSCSMPRAMADLDVENLILNGRQVMWKT